MKDYLLAAVAWVLVSLAYGFASVLTTAADIWEAHFSAGRWSRGGYAADFGAGPGAVNAFRQWWVRTRSVTPS